MLTFLRRGWVPLVVVVAVVLGGVAVGRLRGAFGSEKIFHATGGSAEPLQPSHRKQVTYEVDGPGSTVGSVSYVDKSAQPQQADFTGLPWTFTITTMAPAVLASVVAQGNSDNIACRITVDGVIRDAQSATGRNAQTSCLVKAG
ncbi:transport acessory protein MmpS [Mycobacterium cookii]|uniref:Putative membrane protein, MmpS n=1 Tax=Mycobacterium cookii TaxID=1775 RepID=A0A7I7KYX6_9MYCO|nr:MmpS family transport accessory protein [Mycobacterium cookii]MCV7330544.1 transport acessory protein MmpS [Mycobacterium cookii]BBX47265.1 putative membrane protein, MmpS [Mycobacterium cookii]